MSSVVKLTLVPASLASFDAELAEDLPLLAQLLSVAAIEEWPPVGGQHDADAVTFFRAGLLTNRQWVLWPVYYICVDGHAAGSAGFFGAPVNDEVEIGYSVCARYRRRGIASAAVAALLKTARKQGARSARAKTLPDNMASQRVLTRNGFATDGRLDDKQLVFHVSF
jgi:[ribosomal protein S5]-alanine N-acetyltransferase